MTSPSPHPASDAAPLVVQDWDRLAFRVHRRAYRDDALFAAERSNIWERTWLYLGHETELPNPNDFKVRTLGGRPLIFTRDSTGQLHAFLNSCPHRGTVLCRETQGSSRHFNCFYHAWAFHNTGEVAAIPDPSAYADEEYKASMRLREVAKLEVFEGFVFVSFTDDVPPLEEHLGPAADYIRMIGEQHVAGMEVLPGTQLYGVRGNWKLAVENAMDGYHFSPTHNTFVGYLRESGFAVDDDQYAYNLGNGHSLLILTGHGGRISMLWEPRFGEEERIRTAEHRREMELRLGSERAHLVADESHILFVFPNLLLFDLEGLSIRQLEPVAPGHTDVRAWQLAPRGEDPAVRDLRMRTMVSFVGPGGLATPDDIEAYEAVQRGIEATAGDGRPETDYSDMSRGMAADVSGERGRSTDEGAMRGFWRHWVTAVGEGGPVDLGTPPPPHPEPTPLPSKRPHGLDEILAGLESGAPAAAEEVAAR